jgi:hypothetical protein
MRLVQLTIALALLACGNVDNPNETDAATAADAGADGAPAPDAPDMPPPPVPPGRELASAAGRMSGGGWTADVQLGSLTSQSNATGGTWTAKGGAPLNP